MLLPHHNRYAFSAINTRPDYSWPEGKRLAVYIGLNIEHFAFGAGLTHSLSVPIPPPTNVHLLGVTMETAWVCGVFSRCSINLGCRQVT